MATARPTTSATLIDRAEHLLDATGHDDAATLKLLKVNLKGAWKSTATLTWVINQAKANIAAKSAAQGAVVDAADTALEKYGAERAEREVGRRATSFARSTAVGMARNNVFLGDVQRYLGQTLRGKINVKPYKPKRSKQIERTTNLVLSDLHFQSLLDPKECPVKYGPSEEARRLAWVVLQAAEYKSQYRDRSKLVVHLLGDIIQNQLHDPRDGAPVAAQCCAAIHLLSQALAYLAAAYPKVEVYCVPGNHGRLTSRHPGRAIHQKWDALETVVYYGIKSALAHVPNVEVKLFQTPFYIWESYGMYGMGTHGDTVVSTGQPSRSIEVRSLETQIHKINAARQEAGDPRISLFVGGHVHSLNVHLSSTGEYVVTNGCLVPPDPFSISNGQFGEICAQSIFESVPRFIMGDFRAVIVGRKQDADASLEKIVIPFGGIDV